MSHEPDLGSLLRGYRVRSGLTQEQLAARAGLSIRGLRDLERGRSRRPHLASIHRLAEAIGLSPAERAPLLERVAAPGGGDSSSGAEGGPDAGPPGAPVAGSVVASLAGSVAGLAAWPAAGLVTGSPTVGILGPLMVMVDAQPTRPGAPMLRGLLGLLALHAPGLVPLDEIMAELWGDRPPRTARGQVHVRIGQLRRLLTPSGYAPDVADPIESVNGGYRLRAALDASTFDDLVTTAERARTDGDLDGAGAAYARALRLWRGPALVDVAGLRHHPVIAGLTARRVAAAIAHAALVGPADRPEAVGRLRTLAADEPLHEGLAASLMLTLAADGDVPAALDVHDAMAERLRDELAIEPGPELRAAHLRVRRAATPDPDAADTLDRLGRAHLLRAELDTAAGCFERAAALHHANGDRYAEADSRHWLGDAREAMGDAAAARTAWSAALRILDDLGHDDAAGVRRKLTRSLPATVTERANPGR